MGLRAHHLMELPYHCVHGAFIATSLLPKLALSASSFHGLDEAWCASPYRPLILPDELVKSCIWLVREASQCHALDGAATARQKGQQAVHDRSIAPRQEGCNSVYHLYGPGLV
jgi:hypothetical protein